MRCLLTSIFLHVNLDSTGSRKQKKVADKINKKEKKWADNIQHPTVDWSLSSHTRGGRTEKVGEI